MVKKIFKGLLFVGMMAIIGCCLTSKVVYPAPLVSVPQTPPQPLQSMFVNEAIHVWLLEPQEEREPMVVWLHGNGENIGTMHQAGFFHLWQQMNTGLMAVDYPGYGLSSGRPSEIENVAATNKVIDKARELYPKRPIILVGQSIGSGVAFQSYQHQEVTGLIVISPFTSLETLGQLHYPNWLVSALTFFISDTYDSLQAAQRVNKPTLVMHGRVDQLIPFDHGQQIAQAIPHCQTAWIDGVGHNDIFSSKKTWDALRKFIDQFR